MIRTLKDDRSPGRWLLLCLCGIVWVGLNRGVARAQEPPAAAEERLPDVLPLDAAVRWALQNNPELAAIRQQHGIAAATVVIAQAYPFNPVWNSKVFGVTGPPGVTNHVAMEQRVDLIVEYRGQGKHRREAASAALSRTDWEIAFQEATLAVRAVRAFDAVVYSEEKLRLGERTVRLNEETAQKVRNAVKLGVLKPLDQILAESEVDSSRAGLGLARGPLAKARADLRRALGVIDDTFKVQGTLDLSCQEGEFDRLAAQAIDRRPDLHARQEAVREADARVRLAVADRYGNPNIGPDYEYNETRDNFIGFQWVVPLPVLNTRRGEILQREAELTRAALDLRSTEVVIRQEVQAALDRLRNARTWADSYRKEVLPNLEKSLKSAEALFEQQGGLPLLSVIDIQRRLQKARDGYLDVLFELSQAQADLAAAVGDPGLAIGP
jgi:cobalt-zinc-cadmium efflux system outer membrane protein